MKNQKVKRFACLGVVLVLLASVFLAGCDSGPSEEEHQAALDEVARLTGEQEDMVLVTSDLQSKVVALTSEVESLKAEAKFKLAEEVAEETAVAEEEVSGYELDGIEIGESVEKCLNDKHLNLLDSEVEFDGEDYEVEEVVCLEGLELSVNGKDFGSDVYLTADEGTMKYAVKFDSDLDTSEINEEETLKFDLLGSEVEVVDWDEDEVTLVQGLESELNEGDLEVINDLEVQVVYVDSDGAKFVVNGESTGKLNIGETYQLADDNEIRLVDVLYQPYAGGVHRAEFKIGSDLEVEIENGEEYEEDSAWEWYVVENEIGLVLAEELTYLDEDEDFQAIKAGESICLPEDYVCVTFVGMEEEDTAEYSFDTDEKKGDDYLRVKGEFTFDMEDYDRIYVNEEGIYDSDLEEIGSCLELDDTEFSLCLVEGEVVLTSEDELITLELEVSEEEKLEFSDLKVNGESVASEEEDFRTAYGLVLSNPEDSIDDSDLKVSIPEEQLVGELLVH